MNRNERLCAASFVCALMVVCIHCQSIIPWMHGDATGFGLALCGIVVPVKVDAAIRIMLTETFPRVAVPFFFVLSGYFIASSERGWKGQLKKRLITLYVPFVIWNALNVALNIVGGKWSGIGFLDVLARVFGWDTMVQLGCMQFWYLQSIFVFLLLWPLIRLLLKCPIIAFAIIAVLFAGWIHVYRYWLGMAMGPGNYMWLCMGALFAFYGDVMRRPSASPIVRRGVIVIFAASIAAKVFAGIIRNHAAYAFADYVLICSGLASIFMNLSCFDVVSKVCDKITGLAFFVFAFHNIAITIAIRLGERLSFGGLGLYLFKIVFAITMSLFIGFYFRRFWPRMFGFVTGGRM